MDIDNEKWIKWRTFVYCIRGTIEWCMPVETTIGEVDTIMHFILEEINKAEVKNKVINIHQTVDAILKACQDNERFFLKMPKREELEKYYP